METVLAVIGIILGLLGSLLGVHIWRFCKVHTPEVILASEKSLQAKLTILKVMMIVETIVLVALIITRF